jgi:DNA-binding protein HU-beta
MTRRELIEYVQRQLGGAAGDGKDAAPELGGAQIGRVLDAAFAGIAEALRSEGRYSHPGFGTFTIKAQPARPGLHPKTGAAIEIAAATTVRFKPAREFKATLE